MTNWFPPPSRPRPVEGGLKARSTRGAIAQTWWSERFIEVPGATPDDALPELAGAPAGAATAWEGES